MTLYTLPSCQSLNKRKNKPMLTHTYKEARVVVELAQASAPSGVRQGSVRSLGFLDSDVDEWSVKTMSPSCSAPPLPRRGTACVCEQRLSLLVCTWVCSCVYALLSTYYFGNPRSVMWMAWRRHYTIQRFGVGVCVKRQKSTGLNTPNPGLPWRDPPPPLF